MAHRPSRGERLTLAIALSLLALGGCDWTRPKVPDAEQRSAARKQADARRLRQTCGSVETYDRLKAFVFDEANRLKASRTVVLDRVQANTTVRMENPVAISRDEQLDVTVCRGRLVLDLPPGVEDAFGGARQLRADVEYSAQAAADGSGLVYQMKAAEPIIYRLAALTLPSTDVNIAAATPSLRAAPSVASPERAPIDEEVAVAAPTPRPPPAARRRAEPIAPPAKPSEQAAEPPPSSERPATPSFNCARVTGRVLRAICTDPALAALDRRMSSTFYAALADGDVDTRAALRASRDRFLRFRDRCPTSECIAQSYQDRVAEIRGIAR